MERQNRRHARNCGSRGSSVVVALLAAVAMVALALHSLQTPRAAVTIPLAAIVELCLNLSLPRKNKKHLFHSPEQNTLSLSVLWKNKSHCFTSRKGTSPSYIGYLGDDAPQAPRIFPILRLAEIRKFLPPSAPRRPHASQNCMGGSSPRDHPPATKLRVAQMKRKRRPASSPSAPRRLPQRLLSAPRRLPQRPPKRPEIFSFCGWPK